jgi:HK97 family phage prohead protease
MAYQLRTEKGLPIQQEGKDVLVSDQLEVKIEGLDEKNKSFIAVASTEDEDRDKDIVRQSGWKLSNFKKSPIVPWSHNYYQPPVARSIKTWVADSSKGPRLLFTPKFDADDEDSMKIFNKYKNGFLTSFSVGFQGIEFDFRDEENRWYGGREFTKQELLEISCVGVPANPNANVRLGMNGDVPDNMIQMGYPEVFAQTKTGLFYPITDIAVFSQPKEFEVDKGIIAINAVALDEDIKINGPVAYIFDDELFDDKSANAWIKENAQTTYTVKYFDISLDEKDGIVLNENTEEREIRKFENSVVVSNDTLSNKDIDGDIDDGSQTTETTETDDDASKTTNVDSSDDSRSADGDAAKDSDAKSKDNDDDDVKVSDQNKDNDITIPIKQTIEITTVIKDSEGNVVDQVVETFASNKSFESVMDYHEQKSNSLISLLKSQIDQLTETITNLRNEKTVANDTQIPDNGNNSDDGTGKSITSQDNGEFFELDDSLIKSPDNQDKQSDDTIEIDDSLLTASKSNVAPVVKDTLAEVLKEGLRNALQSVSGRID